MKRILLIALICLFASFQPSWGGRSDYGPVTDCFEIVTGILTAPCQILATCLGWDAQPASRYKKCYEPCHGAPPCPKKKAAKKSAEDYSTKVIPPMSDRPEKPTARQSGPANQPPIPEQASWPPPAAEKPSQGSATGVATPQRTSRPPAAVSQSPSQPSGLGTAAPKARPGQPQQITDKKKEADKTAQMKERSSGDSSRKTGPDKRATPEAKTSVKKEKTGGGAVYQPCAPVMMPMPCYPQFYYR